MTVFIRVHDAAPEAKATALLERIVGYRGAGSEGTVVFTADDVEFSTIPGSPFAYWVGPEIRRIFQEFPPLEGEIAAVKQGLATADDFRFVRTWWEVCPGQIGFSAEDTEVGRGWVHFAKLLAVLC